MTNKINIILTRPYQDSLDFQKQIEQQTDKFNFFIEPLLEIEFLKKDVKINDETQYIITSINSVRALAQNTENRDLKLITVGNTSAKEALNLGFKNVVSAYNKNSELFGEEALLSYIKNNFLNSSKFIHISANVTKGGLVNSIKAMGHNFEKLVLYKSKTQEISQNLLNNIRQFQSLNYVFFSPRTAAIFASQINEKGLNGSFENSFAFCFSKNVLEGLRGIEFKDKLFPSKVDTKNFIELIKTYE